MTPPAARWSCSRQQRPADTWLIGAPTVTAVSPPSGLPAEVRTSLSPVPSFTGATAVDFGTSAAIFAVTSSPRSARQTPPGTVGAVDVTGDDPGRDERDRRSWTSSATSRPDPSPARQPHRRARGRRHRRHRHGDQPDGQHGRPVWHGRRRRTTSWSRRPRSSPDRRRGGRHRQHHCHHRLGDERHPARADQFTAEAPRPSRASARRRGAPAAALRSPSPGTGLNRRVRSQVWPQCGGELHRHLGHPGNGRLAGRPHRRHRRRRRHPPRRASAPPARPTGSSSRSPPPSRRQPQLGAAAGAATSVTITGTGFSGSLDIGAGACSFRHHGGGQLRRELGHQDHRRRPSRDRRHRRHHRDQRRTAQCHEPGLTSTVRGASRCPRASARAGGLPAGGTRGHRHRDLLHRGHRSLVRTTAAGTFTITSATRITVSSPSETAGTVDVTITPPPAPVAPAGRQVHLRERPGRDRGHPDQRVPTGGTSVSITGANFNAATAVSFGAGAAATSFTVSSGTSITAAISPAEAQGTVRHHRHHPRRDQRHQLGRPVCV